MSNSAGQHRCGFLYVVTGSPKYAEEALGSLRSLRAVSPDANVTLITDVPEAEFDPHVVEAFDRVIEKPPLDDAGVAEGEPWKRGLLFRVLHLASSPYERTFFVDSDTLFLEDCRAAFELLDHYDLCATQAPADAETTLFDGRPLLGHTPLNCGMLIYRSNERMKRLITAWYEEYRQGVATYSTDQPALARALLDVPECRVFVLQSIWNTRFPYNERLLGYVRLLHGRHDNLQGIAREINISPRNRVWLANAELCVYRGMGLRAQARVIRRLMWRWTRGLGRRILFGSPPHYPEPGIVVAPPD